MSEQLARYRAMRDFAMTAEPSGASSAKTQSAKGLPFVVQKHAATRLHYDFRLGWRGVLKSWAVTKGPSYNVKDKRLAVEVEDHPIEYGGFEGTIPKGQYGGGTVMVWDQGTWEPVEDVDEGFRKGQLKFILHGQKLKGHWALIRMKGDRFGEKGKNNWLLIKEHDEYERGDGDPAITEEAPDSAITGRSMDQIAADDDHVWQSHTPEKKPPADRSRLTRRSTLRPPSTSPARSAPAKSAPAKVRTPPDRGAVLKGVPSEKMPGFLAPELASSIEQPPEGDAWLHELKLDGYRIQIHIDEHAGRRRARLFTRKGLDWTHRMKDVAAAAAELPVNAAILDGEVVVLTENGTTSFADLQAAFDEGAVHPLTYFAFDLLHLDGHNTRGLPLERRKTILEGLLQESGDQDTLRYSSHIRAKGGAMFREACRRGAEGIVSKLAASVWRSDRSRDWLKSKCVMQQEFVVGGYTPLSNGSHGIGSLLLGVYKNGSLIYAGRTGTGFNRTTHALLRDRLDDVHQAKTPFHDPPAEAKKDAVWTKPTTVVEVRFANWTADNLVRQAAFLGLREDKDPKEVVRETAGAVPRTARRSPSEESPMPESPKSQSPKSNSKTHPSQTADPPRLTLHTSNRKSAAKVRTPASASRSGSAEVAGVRIT
ncbi:MAG: non-homologous end-joining DNA ligase, partial [Acidobacteriaceae bacterium]